MYTCIEYHSSDGTGTAVQLPHQNIVLRLDLVPRQTRLYDSTLYVHLGTATMVYEYVVHVHVLYMYGTTECSKNYYVPVGIARSSTTILSTRST